jgi:hypothetical protein
LRPKSGRLLFGQLVWRKIYIYFFLEEWTIYFTSLLWIPSTLNSDSIWAHGEFLLKIGIKFIFLVFPKELLHATMLLKLPKAEGHGAKKGVYFAHRILVFHYYLFANGFAWCHLPCDLYDLNVKFFIFFKKIYEIHNWSFESRNVYLTKFGQNADF